ncbi:MAG TPA: hypothetical protein VGB59_06320 [Allosphingosinicella sp.]|jgi:hypothetical protein
MKAATKFITGVGAAALVAISAAAPASAEHRRYDRRGGIDAGDIITGVAVLGGIAAVASAIERDFGRYGYGSRDRYRDGYSAAVNSCGYEAERMARGRVRITDVDRTGGDRYRVRGVVEADYRYSDRAYDRYGRYDRYDRYDRSRREDFTCYARGDGRIYDFNL